MRVISPEPVTEPDCELGEGPVWYDQMLTWVDIPAGRIHHADAQLRRLPATTLDRQVGAVVPIVGGGWLAAAGQGFVRVAANGTTENLAQPEAGGTDVRMNDGKCDPRGRFWAGSMSSRRPRAGSLYRLDGDGTVHRILTDIGISNGLGWSPDEQTMYHVDSAAGTLAAFAFDPHDGVPHKRRVFASIAAPAVPDGLCVDDAGAIWLALWDGAAVHRYTSDGRLDTIITMPVRRPTSCCFAGDTLYITTARTDYPEPMAGAVFACRPGVTGPTATPYQHT